MKMSSIYLMILSLFLVCSFLTVCEHLNSNTWFQDFILCWNCDHKKCWAFNMKLVMKNLFITEIFKYFVMSKVLLCSDCVFTLWLGPRFLDIPLDSKWNDLFHSYFCCLFVWMYWFSIGNCIWTSHNNSIHTENSTWKSVLDMERIS